MINLIEFTHLMTRHCHFIILRPHKSDLIYMCEDETYASKRVISTLDKKSQGGLKKKLVYWIWKAQCTITTNYVKYKQAGSVCLYSSFFRFSTKKKSAYIAYVNIEVCNNVFPRPSFDTLSLSLSLPFLLLLFLQLLTKAAVGLTHLPYPYKQ